MISGQSFQDCGEQNNEKNRFVKNLKFTKELFGEERSGTLHFGKGEVKGYLQETHSDPLRDESKIRISSRDTVYCV